MKFSFSFSVSSDEEMDPTFKGITTSEYTGLAYVFAHEEMDPTFKGITTLS